MIEIQVVPEQPKALEVEAEGWWNDDHDVYTWPVRVGKWGAKIECHGSTPMEAQALALHVVTAIGAIGKAAPAPEVEAPTAVGALILGGAVSSTELGDNDVTLDSQVVERIQRELVKDSEDIAVELMLVEQHYRILQALRADRDNARRTAEYWKAEHLAANAALDAAQARVAELERGTVYVEARRCSACGHGGVNDGADGLSACGHCEWTGPQPSKDECPDCLRKNCMSVACPECAGRYELVAEAKVAAPVAQAGQVPSVCDGKEQDAFEAWATGQKMDISCHPLHWLFLNEKTYSARQGWKAALEYVGSQIAAAPAQGGA